MSEKLKKLKNIGSQKIYEDTHIPIDYIEAILHEDYTSLTRVQYQGFISILEREYGVDLSDEKVRALEYFNDASIPTPLANDTIFHVPTKSKNLKILYIAFIVIVFFIALFYFGNSSEEKVVPQPSAILQESVVKEPIIDDNISAIVVDKNESIIEDNVTVKDEKELKVQKPEVVALEPLKILPRSRVWLGYTNVVTNKKEQKTFSNELDLDGNSEWLMIFGHGYVSVIAHGKEHKFSDKNVLRLHYKDGSLEKISADEFKRLNRGHKW